MNNEIKIKDKVYYARIIPTCGLYNVYELTVRTVENDWFVGIEKGEKRAFLFPYSQLGITVFINRKDALKKVQEAEQNKMKISNETYYEEY